MEEREEATSSIRVVAAVIERGGRILLARRPEGKRHAGMWEFPGGKVLEGETDFEALARELREELDLVLEALDPEIFAATDPGSAFSIHFLPAQVSGTPRAIEHAELRWWEGDALTGAALAPADTRFARFYAARRL